MRAILLDDQCSPKRLSHFTASLPAYQETKIEWVKCERVFGTAFASGGGMSLCASCGLQLSGEAALCPHHHCVYGDDWAVANRIMCDFFHRKKIPPRLAQQERDDDFWAHTAEAA
jgi:hypothetical protein